MAPEREEQVGLYNDYWRVSPGKLVIGTVNLATATN